jgi:glycosyltransferase involved in cell wall biosynthesis
MKVLIVATYYQPYVSGVTEFARMLAEHLALGHDVTVLCARHDPLSPVEEVLNGVRVVRAPVMLRLHKGVISPIFVLQFRRLAAAADVVNLHLPMLEAAALSVICDKRRLMSTYHCDMAITGGLVDSLAVVVARWSARVALTRSACIAVTTLDYAMSSAIVRRHQKKLIEVRAPLKRPPIDRSREFSNCDGGQARSLRVGFVGRFVEEKGLPVLLQAFSRLLEDFPDARLVLAGDSSGVAGGSTLPKIQSQIMALGDAIELRGRVGEAELWSIYAGLDILALPSVNRYEAFGMVQIEAMMAGALVVASDLPGVRTVVANTGNGFIASVGDIGSLHHSLKRAASLRQTRSRQQVRDAVLTHYPAEESLEIQERALMNLVTSGR